MKSTKIALVALATTLAISPLAFGSSISAFDVYSTQPGAPKSFEISGQFNTANSTVVTPSPASSGFFTLTNLGSGETDVVDATYRVVPTPAHKYGFEGSGPNDNKFSNTDDPFDASGLLIQMTSGPLKYDFVYITGVFFSQTGEMDVSEYQASGTHPSLSSVPTGKLLASSNYVLYNPDFKVIPEPSSLLLLGTGMLSLAGMVFWKSRPTAKSFPASTF